MRYRRNLWLWILGLPLFLGVSAHWGFYFLVKDRLDQLASRASQLGFHYESLRTSLLGEVSLEGVRLKPPGYAAPITVDRLKLKGPAVPLYLLRNNPLVGLGPPRHLSLHFDKVWWPPVAASDAKRACEIEKGMLLPFFEALWRAEEPANLDVSYRYRSAPAVLEGEVSTRAGGAHALELSVRLVNVTPKGFHGGQLGTALLGALKTEVTVEPQSGKRLVHRCADALRLPVAVFENRMASVVLRRLEEMGAAAESGLKQALERYFHRWGELEVELRPPVPMNLAFLPFIPSGQLQKKLGVVLRIDGEKLTGNYFRDVPRSAEEPHAQKVKRAAKRPSRPRPKERRRYRPVAVASLSRYLGHRVRLRARGEPPRQGILLKVAEGEAMVEQRLQGGTLTVPVPLRRLIGAEVFLPEKDRD